MIRLVGKKLIIPRGDTGSFSVPLVTTFDPSDKAIFSILDEKTQKVIQRIECVISEEALTVNFTHYDTVNLPIGKYYWDIKSYKNPEIVDGELVNGTEVDSYYAAYSLPVCEIRQTGDKLLNAEDDEPSILNQQDFNLLNATLNEVRNANTALQQYKGEIEDMLHQEQRLETIENTLQTLMNNLQLLRDELQQHISEVDDMLNHEERIQSLETTISSLNTTIANLNNLINLQTISLYEQQRHGQPKNLIGFNNCDGLCFYYEDTPIGNEVPVYEATLTIDQLNNIKNMLSYYESITPFTSEEMNAIRGKLVNPSDPSGEEPAPAEEPAPSEEPAEEPAQSP